jgi:hypothetical protein
MGVHTTSITLNAAEAVAEGGDGDGAVDAKPGEETNAIPNVTLPATDP